MAIPKHIIHNDEPGLDKGDHFHQLPLVKTIADSIAIHALPPFVASLYGDWGQGKTSILEAVYTEITGEKPENFSRKTPPGAYRNVRVIWFEAWRYQHDPTPVVALLNEIRKQLEQLSRFKLLDKKAFIAFEAGLQILANVTAQIAPFAGIIDTVKTSSATWEQRNLSYSLPSQTIRELLDKAIKDILGSITEPSENTQHAPRLVVIIDDLDRCQPNVAYKLLEGLKIFLNLQSCSFLIGSNRKEITDAVRIGLQNECGVPSEGNGERATEYLEKLCSYSWDLPFPTTREIAVYVDHLLKKCAYTVITPQRNEIRTILEKADHLILPANPRRIKSFVNILTQLASLGANRKKDDILEGETEYLLSLAYIVAFLPDAHRHLLANPSSIKNLHMECLKPLATKAAPEAGSDEAEKKSKDGGPDKAILSYSDPFLPIMPTEDDLRYMPPEACHKFRMALVFAKVKVIPDDLIHKYLPHATQ